MQRVHKHYMLMLLARQKNGKLHSCTLCHASTDADRCFSISLYQGTCLVYVQKAGSANRSRACSYRAYISELIRRCYVVPLARKSISFSLEKRHALNPSLVRFSSVPVRVWDRSTRHPGIGALCHVVAQADPDRVSSKLCYSSILGSARNGRQVPSRPDLVTSCLGCGPRAHRVHVAESNGADGGGVQRCMVLRKNELQFSLYNFLMRIHAHSCLVYVLYMHAYIRTSIQTRQMPPIQVQNTKVQKQYSSIKAAENASLC
jgi:hypothetical protein